MRGLLVCSSLSVRCVTLYGRIPRAGSVSTTNKTKPLSARFGGQRWSATPRKEVFETRCAPILSINVWPASRIECLSPSSSPHLQRKIAPCILAPNLQQRAVQACAVFQQHAGCGLVWYESPNRCPTPPVTSVLALLANLEGQRAQRAL